MTSVRKILTLQESTISRPRIYDALRWLVANNPLYRGVTINNDGDVILQISIIIIFCSIIVSDKTELMQQSF